MAEQPITLQMVNKSEKSVEISRLFCYDLYVSLCSVQCKESALAGRYMRRELIRFLKGRACSHAKFRIDLRSLEQSRAATVTAAFLHPAAAGRMKLNMAFAMDDRWV